MGDNLPPVKDLAAWINWKVAETAAPNSIHSDDDTKASFLHILYQRGWMKNGSCRPKHEIAMILLGVGMLGRDIIAGQCLEPEDDGLGATVDPITARLTSSLWTFQELEDIIFPAMEQLHQDIIAAPPVPAIALDSATSSTPIAKVTAKIPAQELATTSAPSVTSTAKSPAAPTGVNPKASPSGARPIKRLPASPAVVAAADRELRKSGE